LLLLGVAASQRLVIEIVLATESRDLRTLVPILAAQRIFGDGVIVVTLLWPVVGILEHVVRVRVPHTLERRHL
jgi:hypothetical protein